ncbi:MAG: CHASE2 domain-containing protein, partial [Nostoc sp.]
MMRRIWTKINSANSIWCAGFTTIAFVTFLRLVGSLQFLECIVFDTFMRLRPEESIDERILIVGINEKDINRIKAYPIPDKDIAALLNKLKTYQP